MHPYTPSPTSGVQFNMDWVLFLISTRVGDDGIMSTRYTREFRDRAVRLLADSRENYSSQTQALVGVAKSLGVSMESLRRWRTQADDRGSEGTQESGELRKLRRENAELRRANEILSSASAFFASRLDPTRR